MGLFVSELVSYFEHKPATFLRNELSVHTAAVVTRVEEIAHIESQSEPTQLIFASDVEDGAGLHVVLENDRFLSFHQGRVQCKCLFLHALADEIRVHIGNLL